MTAQDFTRDLRFAFRSYRRHLGFSAIATLTIALGSGATVSIFSVISGVLLQSLPYEQPDELMRVWTTNLEAGVERGPFSGADLVNYREQTSSFEALSGYFPYDATFLDLEGNAFKLPAVIALEDFFSVMRVLPLAGRLFVLEDHISGSANRRLVISHRMWSTMSTPIPV